MYKRQGYTLRYYRIDIPQELIILICSIGMPDIGYTDWSVLTELLTVALPNKYSTVTRKDGELLASEEAF